MKDYSVNRALKLLEDHLDVYPDRTSAMLRATHYHLRHAVERQETGPGGTKGPGGMVRGQSGEIVDSAASQEVS